MKKVGMMVAMLSFSAVAASINELAPNELNVRNEFWDTTDREALTVSQSVSDEVNSFDGCAATSSFCVLDYFDSRWIFTAVSDPTPYWTGSIGFLLFLK